MPNKSHFPHGLLLALIFAIIDQVHKWYMIEIVDIANNPIQVTSFFNLVMVWNRGISFGIGNQLDNAILIFVAFPSLIVMGLLIWMYRTDCKITALALGLLIGGAVGNIIDRFNYGAVADFFDFHINGYHWPAFNIADSIVFIGAIVLCLTCLYEDNNEKNNE